MADLSVQGFSVDGTDISFSSADSSGDKFPNNGSVLYIVENNDNSSKDVTFTTTATVEGESVSDKKVTVSANTTRIFGPFRVENYNNSDGDVDVSYSATTSVNVAAVRPVNL